LIIKAAVSVLAPINPKPAGGLFQYPLLLNPKEVLFGQQTGPETSMIVNPLSVPPAQPGPPAKTVVVPPAGGVVMSPP
jgi:hypothetical protein